MTQSTRSDIKKLISIVCPCYNEVDNVEALHAKICDMSKESDSSFEFEIIFVDDGSTDGTIDKLIQVRNKDSRTKIIELSRNFGQAAAITAGLDHAIGDAVVVIDADLQDPPSLIIEMIEKWLGGTDIVYARRSSRSGENWFKKFTSFLYYRVVNWLSDVKIPEDTGEFKLMSRKVVDEIKKMREKNRSMRNLVAFLGFKTEVIYFDRQKRNAGKTKFNLKKMIKLAMDSIFCYSTRPIEFIGTIGGVQLVVGFMIFLLAALTRQDFSYILVGVITMLFGLQTIFLYIIGNYVIRIYSESVNRPIYIVKNLYG